MTILKKFSRVRCAYCLVAFIIRIFSLKNLLSIYCDKKGILPEHVDFPIEPLSHI